MPRNDIQKQGRILMLPVDCIEPSPYQARTAFDEPEIAALAVSILQNGLLQPISVRRVGLHKYQLVAGERRLRACRLAKLDKVPAILADYDDSESAALGLLENLQRSQLDPFDTARGIKEVIRLWGCTQAEAARRLGLSQPARELRGQLISQVIDPVPFFDTQTMLAKDTHDEICRFNDLTVIASRVRIMLEDSLQGWVITFRDRNEIDTLSTQLSQVKRYVDNLRIMRHEQLNWTATLVGLLQMKHYDEAIRYIQVQSEGAQRVLDFVSARFSSPALCGLLLGKYVSAREKGIELLFDPACQLTRMPATLNETELMSIIGNLLDNAVDATLKAPVPAPVELYISDRNQELLIEVADRGCGVEDAMKPHIFRQGFSSKPERENDIVGTEHGIGLYLVAGYIDKAGGSIEIADNTPQGTIFSVFIPNGLKHDPST